MRTVRASTKGMDWDRSSSVICASILMSANGERRTKRTHGTHCELTGLAHSSASDGAAVRKRKNGQQIMRRLVLLQILSSPCARTRATTRHDASGGGARTNEGRVVGTRRARAAAGTYVHPILKELVAHDAPMVVVAMVVKDVGGLAHGPDLLGQGAVQLSTWDSNACPSGLCKQGQRIRIRSTCVNEGEDPAERVDCVRGIVQGRPRQHVHPSLQDGGRE